MNEENEKREPGGELVAGKFKSVDALVSAYEELEAEFTRRSQRLKALEEAAATPPPERGAPDGEALYRAASENEEVRARILGDYVASCRGVSLLGGAGTGVTAPAARPKNIREAGALALGYLKKNQS